MVNLDYLYNPDAAKPYFTKDYFIDEKLGFQVIEKGTILPYKQHVPTTIPNLWGAGGIVDKDGTHIKNSFAYTNLISQHYTPPPNQFNTAPKPSFISACFTTFGDMT